MGICALGRPEVDIEPLPGLLCTLDAEAGDLSIEYRASLLGLSRGLLSASETLGLQTLPTRYVGLRDLNFSPHSGAARTL